MDAWNWSYTVYMFFFTITGMGTDSYWGVAFPQLLMATGGLEDWGSRVGQWEGITGRDHQQGTPLVGVVSTQ